MQDIIANAVLQSLARKDFKNMVPSGETKILGHLQRLVDAAGFGLGELQDQLTTNMLKFIRVLYFQYKSLE